MRAELLDTAAGPDRPRHALLQQQHLGTALTARGPTRLAADAQPLASRTGAPEYVTAVIAQGLEPGALPPGEGSGSPRGHRTAATLTADRVRIGKDAIGGADRDAISAVAAAMGLDPEHGWVERIGRRRSDRLGWAAELAASAVDARLGVDRVTHGDRTEARITPASSERCAPPRRTPADWR
jgi:hypothetical protein